jgi:hypothetical protein
MKMSYGSRQRCRLRDWPDGVLKENVLVAATMVAATMVVYTPEYHFGTSDTSNDLQTILSN